MNVTYAVILRVTTQVWWKKIRFLPYTILHETYFICYLYNQFELFKYPICTISCPSTHVIVMSRMISLIIEYWIQIDHQPIKFYSNMAVLGHQKTRWRVWSYIYIVLGKIASSRNWNDIPMAYCPLYLHLLTFKFNSNMYQ